MVWYTVPGRDGVHTNVNVENLASISEANQNFSTAARLMDERGAVIILKNYELRYVLENYSLFHRDTVADEEDVDDVTARILSKHIMGVEQLVT